MSLWAVARAPCRTSGLRYAGVPMMTPVAVAAMWMAAAGCGARFSEESLARLFTPHRLVRQELEGYVTIELLVVGLEDDAHPARAEPAQDVVVSDLDPDQGFHDTSLRSIAG